MLALLFGFVAYATGALFIYREHRVDDRSSDAEENFALLSSIFWPVTAVITVVGILIDKIKEKLE